VSSPRFDEVYAELRRIAAARLAAEAPGQTLEATALVHEAYLRIFATHPEREFADRTHLLAAAAEVIRLILIDRARAKGRDKRGGGRKRLDLRQPIAVHDLPPDGLLDLTEALEALAAEDREGRARETAPLRGPVRRRGGRDSRRFAGHRRSALGLCPRVAARPPFHVQMTFFLIQ
jgi:RNA polymerase sigma factor (TIGR02999 family)